MNRIATTLVALGIAAVGSVAIAPAASAAPVQDGPSYVIDGPGMDSDNGNGPRRLHRHRPRPRPRLLLRAQGRSKDKERQATTRSRSDQGRARHAKIKHADRGARRSAHDGVRPLPERPGQPSRAAWKAANFDWVSASSATGSDPATMPQPANSRAPLVGR